MHPEHALIEDAEPLEVVSEGLPTGTIPLGPRELPLTRQEYLVTLQSWLIAWIDHLAVVLTYATCCSAIVLSV
jgi:hypothetical protein